MITAKLLIKGEDKPLGRWDFASLPREGKLLAIRVNDQPTVFQVAGVIHVPVMFPSVPADKIIPPTVDVVITGYGVDL